MAKRNGKQQQKPVLDVPVDFKNVSIGKTTARLGASFDRSSLNINAADDTFCGHRLTGRVLLGGSDAANGQGQLFDEDEYDGVVSGIFDVKRISAGPDDISCGLTFSLKDVDIERLAKFSGGKGRVQIQDVAPLPEDVADEHEEDKEPMPKVDGEWRKFSLSKLFKGALLKALIEADITTVGQMSDFNETGKELSAIAGIGPGKQAKIEETMLAFWEANPDAKDLEEAEASK
jgi:hypothetical protein